VRALREALDERVARARLLRRRRARARLWRGHACDARASRAPSEPRLGPGPL